MKFDEVLGLSHGSIYTEGDHRSYYQTIINALGYDDVKHCIPFSFQELLDAYKEDERLNTLPMKEWDRAAGFVIRGVDYIPVGSRLTHLYYEKCGVTTFSCCQGVCILKECARMWVEEEIEKC